jgi:hypothetical protein
MNARIPCSTEVRQLVKAQKRGGESYDSLLRKMAEQYEPNGSDLAPSDGEQTDIEA